MGYFRNSSQFHPVWKGGSCVKMTLKARKLKGAAGTGYRAAKEAAEKAQKEMAKEFFGNIKHLLKEQTYVLKFMENTALAQTGQASWATDEATKVFLDKAIEE